MGLVERYREQRTIGDYTLIKLLGRGGMGSVWRATHHNGADVALKIVQLPPDETAFELTARLRREMLAAATIDHDAVIQMYCFDFTPEGDPYVAMEYVPGESLASFLEKRGAMSPIAAARVLVPVAGALAIAHAEGVIHRDIKPENMMIASGENRYIIKLLDFGIAKLSRTYRNLTKSGTVIGTPHYMAPEQASGKKSVDHRADVWSLSVTLFELLTDGLPFPGRHIHQVLVDILKEPPRSLAYYDLNEPELAEIIERNLDKDPLARDQSMTAFRTRLATWLKQRGHTTDLSGRRLDAFRDPGPPVRPSQAPSRAPRRNRTPPPKPPRRSRSVS